MSTMTYANPRHAPVRTARRLHATADMNITPMIDVLLVLLVIFMAALPLSQTGLDATVPADTQPQASACHRRADRGRVLGGAAPLDQPPGRVARAAARPPARGVRRAARQDALHHGRRRAALRRGGRPSSTRPRAPAWTRSASSRRRCADALMPRDAPSAPAAMPRPQRPRARAPGSPRRRRWRRGAPSRRGGCTRARCRRTTSAVASEASSRRASTRLSSVASGASSHTARERHAGRLRDRGERVALRRRRRTPRRTPRRGRRRAPCAAAVAQARVDAARSSPACRRRAGSRSCAGTPNEVLADDVAAQVQRAGHRPERRREQRAPASTCRSPRSRRWRRAPRGRGSSSVWASVR